MLEREARYRFTYVALLGFPAITALLLAHPYSR
ncbi:hypothetical protein [Azospirillum argentinense]